MTAENPPPQSEPENAPNSRPENMTAAEARKLAKQIADASRDWRKELKESGQLRPELPASAEGLEKGLLQLGIPVRFNVRNDTPEYQPEFANLRGGPLIDPLGNPDWADSMSVEQRKWAESRTRVIRSGILHGSNSWQTFHDRAQAKTRAILARRFSLPMTDRHPYPRPYELSDAKFSLYLTAKLHDSEVDPFKNFLENVVPEWDQEPRLDTWPLAVWEIDRIAELEPVIAYVGRFIFQAPIVRTLDPGAKLDLMPILQGPQKCGKSLALRNIFPPEFQRAWFTDSLRLDIDRKEIIELTLGKCLCEIPELIGLGRAGLPRLKGLLSAQEDRARLSYRRDAADYPRQFAVIGSTNDDNPVPNDPTGTRRFMVLPISGRGTHPEKLFGKYRLQLWAEALARIKSGETLEIDSATEEVQFALNEEFRRADRTLEDYVQEAIEKGIDGFTLAHIRRINPELDSRYSDLRLGRALANAGYRKRRIQEGGKRRYVWHTEGAQLVNDY